MHPLDRFRLDDKVVVITGASSGLGRGFAHAVSAVGAHVVLAARRVDLLESLGSDLRAKGTRVLVHRADVSSLEDCESLAAASADEFGRIDVLVNNAGIGIAGSALRQSPDDYLRTVDINLNGTFWAARSCAPHMPPGSAIVNVASVIGWVANRYPQAGYAASKAGVIGLTRDLAQQWSGRRGIRVNALCPGFFASEMTTAEGSENLQRMVAENSMLGRFGEQDELDSALLFLATPASSYMTGASLIVDGGISAMV